MSMGSQGSESADEQRYGEGAYTIARTVASEGTIPLCSCGTVDERGLARDGSNTHIGYV